MEFFGHLLGYIVVIVLMIYGFVSLVPCANSPCSL